MKRACEERVPILEVHQMNLSCPWGTVDGHHFSKEVFKSAENELFIYSEKVRKEKA